jgi:hypothetical protein
MPVSEFKKLALWSLIGGAAILVFLFVAATINANVGTSSAVENGLSYLLAPGAFLAMALGNNHIHDLDYILIGLIGNFIAYSLIVFGVLLVRRSVRRNPAAVR